MSIINIFDKNGWLVNAQTKRTIDIGPKDIDSLLMLAKEEDKWIEKNEKDAAFFDEHELTSRAMLYSMIDNYSKVKCTRVPFPYGYVYTFQSRRHLFRGEVEDYRYSETSLSRRCRDNNGSKRTTRNIEIIHVIANMRIIQFIKFLRRFDFVLQWEKEVGEINYKALAQHYGFDTFLLDFTNNVLDALFFANCKWNNDHFEPLTQEDILNKQKEHDYEYGIIYHIPCWQLDYLDCRSIVNNPDIIHNTEKQILDGGKCDGLAYQIGLQPLMRAYCQFGYVYPMKKIEDIKKSGIFERIRFRHTVEFSQYIYDKMDKGKKIYPDEGIKYVSEYIDVIKKAMRFSEDDMLQAYEEVDKSIFPTSLELRDELDSSNTKNLLKEAYKTDEVLIIQKEEVDYPLPKETINRVNEWYKNNTENSSIYRGVYSL